LVCEHSILERAVFDTLVHRNENDINVRKIDNNAIY